eukprot:9215504-Heterocapsa_arctica.AAC.1
MTSGFAVTRNIAWDVVKAKAKHIDTAKRVFWRRQICTPALRLRQYQDKQHKIGFLNWWHCIACEAKGPDMNKAFCSSYTHTHTPKKVKTKTAIIPMTNMTTIHPGYKIRQEAYHRVVENHKNK